MAITLNGTTGISSPGGDTSTSLATTNLSYTGTLTGGTGVIAIGTNQIYKDASGNVGVGTATQINSGKITVAANIAVSAYASSFAGYSMQASGTGGREYRISSTDNTNGLGGGLFALYDQTANSLRLSVDSSGNLFLTQGYLSLGNNGYIRAESAGWLQFQGGSSGSRFMNSSNASALMTLDSGGNLGVGTSYAGSIAKLTVSNTTTTDNSRIGVVASTYLSTPTYAGTFVTQGDAATTGTTCGISNANLGALYFQNTSNALIWTNGGAAIVFATASVERASISGSGVFKINNLAGSGSRAVNADASGNLSAASDSSLKQEDKGAPIPGLKEILKITPRAYKWLSDIENRGDEAATEIGFFADEVAPIIPSAAPKCADGLYGFYDRSVTAALVKAIQELTTRLEALEAQ